jgi:hypothetical protein
MCYNNKHKVPFITLGFELFGMGHIRSVSLTTQLNPNYVSSKLD